MSVLPEEASAPRLYKQLEEAEGETGRGNPSYALTVCGDLVERYPGWVSARRSLRRAQSESRTAKGKPGIGQRILCFLAAIALRGFAVLSPVRCLRWAEFFLELDPMHPGLNRAVGIAADRLGFRETMIFSYETARIRDPGNWANLTYLAEAYYQLDRLSEAATLCQLVLERHPGDAKVERLLQEVLVAQSLGKDGWLSRSD